MLLHYSEASPLDPSRLGPNRALRALCYFRAYVRRTSQREDGDAEVAAVENAGVEKCRHQTAEVENAGVDNADHTAVAENGVKIAAS